MKTILFNQNQQLRNGWWIAIFIAILAVSRLVYPVLSETIQSFGVDKEWLGPLSVVMLIVVTWICTKMRNESLADVGLRINPTWFKQLTAGIAIGGLQIALIVALMLGFGGISLHFNSEWTWQLILSGLYIFLFAAMLEELLFRGFIFQRLIQGIGIWPAQLMLASVFAIGHLTNPEVNQDTIVFAALDIGLGAILWGLAYIKTGSLALPIGLHLGWNWIQGDVFGFAVSGYEKQGILIPILNDKPTWITGAGFGAEATLFAAIIDIVFIVILLRWQGTGSTPLFASEYQCKPIAKSGLLQ